MCGRRVPAPRSIHPPQFYDRDGHLAQSWFDQLTLRTKSKLFATVAGNHDYWGFGDSIVALDKDQFGNGNVQFYGMDSAASMAVVNSSVPGQFMDLSIDPDAPKVRVGANVTAQMLTTAIHTFVHDRPTDQ